MSIREEQCRKVCRILDDVLANRPTERDALCVAVDKAFEALIQSEQQRTGKWLWQTGKVRCNQCLRAIRRIDHDGLLNFCPNCGAEMTEGDSE